MRFRFRGLGCTQARPPWGVRTHCLVIDNERCLEEVSDDLLEAPLKLAHRLSPSRILNSAPSSALACSATSFIPSRSKTWRDMNSPYPLPPGLVLTPGLKMSSPRSGAIPGPLSRTAIH